MERIVKEYKVIEAEGIDKLNTSVNSYITQGWHPLGGPSVYTYDVIGNGGFKVGINATYSQALVRYHAQL